MVVDVRPRVKSDTWFSKMLHFGALQRMTDAEFSEQARVVSGQPTVVHENILPLKRVESGATRSSHFGT